MRVASRPFLLVAGTLLAGSSLLLADTLVLRDGKRLEGTLVGVRGDTIEFETSGWSRRTERIPRDEVRRIELDSYGNGSSGSSRDDNYGSSSGSGYGRPSGLRQRTVYVVANSPWTDTGVEVRNGDTVYFEATGKVRWGKDRNDDAAGERNSPRNPGRPIPERAGAALIGRVGGSDPFFIGKEEGAIRMRSGGRLQLGINDDYLQDNSGQLRVVVYY
jgi:hypothetical protein